MTNRCPHDSIHCWTKAVDPCSNMHNNFIYIEWTHKIYEPLVDYCGDTQRGRVKYRQTDGWIGR